MGSRNARWRNVTRIGPLGCTYLPNAAGRNTVGSTGIIVHQVKDSQKRPIRRDVAFAPSVRRESSCQVAPVSFET